MVKTLFQLFRKNSEESKGSWSGNEELTEISQKIVKNALKVPNGVIGLGSGAPIDVIAKEFVKHAKELKTENITVVCTQKKMLDYLRSYGVPARMYELEYDIPRLNSYIETINCVCTLNDYTEPICIKSDATSKFSGAMLKKSRSVVLIRLDSAIESSTVRGIPMELENNSRGYHLFKTWAETRGGVMALRTNMATKGDRFQVEWVPPDEWKYCTACDKLKKFADFQRELDEIPGVLSHNLFASKNCKLVDLEGFNTDFKKLLNAIKV